MDPTSGPILSSRNIVHNQLTVMIARSHGGGGVKTWKLDERHAPLMRIAPSGSVLFKSSRAELVLTTAGFEVGAKLPLQLVRELRRTTPGEALHWCDEVMGSAVSFAVLDPAEPGALLVANNFDPDPRPAPRRLHAQHLEMLGATLEHVEPKVRDRLTALTLNAGLLEGPESSVEDREGATEAIATGIAELSRLFDEMAPSPLDEALAFSVPVRPSLDRVVARLQARCELHQHVVRVAVRDDCGPTDVQLPRAILEHSLVNIVTNALETRSRGVCVDLVCQPAPDGSDTILLRICDDGPGFYPGVRALAFHPFFTTKTRGVGLGLARTRAALAEHGAGLEIDPTARGGCVVLRVPSLPRPSGVVQELHA